MFLDFAFCSLTLFSQDLKPQNSLPNGPKSSFIQDCCWKNMDEFIRPSLCKPHLVRDGDEERKGENWAVGLSYFNM